MVYHGPQDEDADDVEVTTARRCKRIVSEGLFERHKEIEGQEKASTGSFSISFAGDAWVRVLLFKSLEDDLKAESSKSLEDRQSDMLKDAQETVETWKAGVGFSPSLQLSVDDMMSFSVLVATGCDPSKASARNISVAMKHLGTLRMRALSDALNDSELGKTIMLSESCLLQESAKDEVGHEKLSLLPRFWPTNGCRQFKRHLPRARMVSCCP